MKQSEIKQLLTDLSHVCDVGAKYSTKIKPKDRVKLQSQNDVFNLMHQWYINTEMYEQREIFSVLLMTRSNQVLGIVKCGEGTPTSCIVDKQYIARLAILANAQAVILCHNHPSGNVNPSDADIALTKQLKEALKLLDIAVLDHVILTQDNGYTSLATQDLM
jgi:DNA repair protein RadC